MNKLTIRIGLIAILILLAVHLAILPDYGLTWDFHFHFFSGANFFGLKPEDVEPRALPYVAPDPRISIHLPYGPFVQIVPFASWLLLYKNLHILPYDVAYNLPIVIAGVLGIGALYFFLAEAINPRVGLVAALFLALTPRYFADIHNNMKDAPMAAVFALNMWMLWRLWRFRRGKDLVLTILAFALAFNTKINSIFIPVIFAAWLILLRSKTTKLLVSYFLLAPIAAFLLWWFFWGDPIGQLKLATLTFGWGADNIEVLLHGQWFCAGSTVPWYYPFWYLAITTPLPILLCFLIGLISLMRRIRPINLLLLLWFFLPLTRYLLPKIAVIDGVRHFEEVLFPLAAIAAIGATKTITWLQTIIGVNLIAAASRLTPSFYTFHTKYFTKVVNNLTVITLLTTFTGGILVWLVIPIVRYHPFQIAYFNELVGGIQGAIGKYDIDYWGSSQKKAAEWLNTNAPNDASVHVVMAGNVAGLYLRPDLLKRLNTLGQNEADYVVVLNRQSFFYRYYYLFEYVLQRKPAYVIENQGVPIVWIFDNRIPLIPRQTPWWTGEDPCIQKYWK